MKPYQQVREGHLRSREKQMVAGLGSMTAAVAAETLLHQLAKHEGRAEAGALGTMIEEGVQAAAAVVAVTLR